MTSVTITTGSRLHFGLLAHRPQTGREFGGVGVMIDSPGWTVRIEKLEADGESRIQTTSQVTAAAPDIKARVDQIVSRCRDISPTAGWAVRVSIESAIPSHRGLGSGTQLALAIARGLDLVLADGTRPCDELARFAGRGLRSAVGTWGFELGGCIFEGGRTQDDPVGRFISQVAVPADWRFVLITPQSGVGLSGGEEASAFDRLTGMSTELTAELCRIAAMELLPAMQAGDFQPAADALGRYGQLAGEYFAPVQNGIYLHPAMAQVSDRLGTNGWTGFAQTSWGPTCFVMCDSDQMAADVCETVRGMSNIPNASVEVVAPLNTGAKASRS